MRKDPTEFRERFLRWKNGELVYENGLALPAYEDDKWNPNDTYTADAGMIKSKLAIASHFGNPTARRMTNYDGRDYTWPGEYEYINGVGEPKRGNVYVGSYDNLVTPQILDNGKTLEFIDNPWNPKNELRSYKQSLKFNNMRDAWSFGENYKKYAPMMNRYEDGKTSINSPIFEDFADPYEQLSPLDEEPVLTTNKKLPDEIVSRKTFTPQDLKNDIRDFYTIDFVQRRRNYHPEESAEQITNLFNVSPILFGTLDSNTGGIYNKGNIIINNKLSDNLKRSTAVHEMRHVMDHQLERLTPEELLLLHKAYDLKADKDYLHLENEYPTTNTELRYSISKDHNNAVGKDLDNVIKNISDEDLILRASMINGYNKIPDKTIKPKNSKLLLEQKTKADAIRKALMEVAYNSQKQDDRLIYAKDGLIPPILNL